MLQSVDNKIKEDERTLAQQLFRLLSDAIVSGEFPAGSKLSEPLLARRYGVSRGPLREALNRLLERRLVTHSPHVGARVATLSAQVLEEIFIVREALEGMAARQAAERATDENIAALHRAYARRVAATKEGDGPVWRPHDEDFHFLIAQASGNPTLIEMLTKDFYPLVQFYRSRLVNVHGYSARTIAEHRRILEAIEDGDGDLAEMQMRRHIAAARVQWGAVLRNQQQIEEPDE